MPISIFWVQKDQNINGEKMKKILIMDDYKLECLLLTEVLNRKYKIKAVYNGSRIYQIIEEYKPDLIILDIVMPKTSGLDILSKIGKNFKVIVISSIPYKYISKIVHELGARFFIEKPIDLNLIKGIIDEELSYIS